MLKPIRRLSALVRSGRSPRLAKTKRKNLRAILRLEECESRLVPANLWAYTGAGYGDWGAPANLSQNSVPDANTDVEFPAGKGDCRIITQPMVKMLTIDAGYKGTVWITATNAIVQVTS